MGVHSPGKRQLAKAEAAAKAAAEQASGAGEQMRLVSDARKAAEAAAAEAASEAKAAHAKSSKSSAALREARAEQKRLLAAAAALKCKN